MSGSGRQMYPGANDSADYSIITTARLHDFSFLDQTTTQGERFNSD
jgi:hypothetical protein